ncbi:hypothetical protein LIER_31727 [Lithospermum erythrorhizon]|uniref:Uncharacterized protein n=1 Tax=Lithospermum erythrorhizon TaxID=34254 RepID=A0AAV3RU17_LITER
MAHVFFENGTSLKIWDFFAHLCGISHQPFTTVFEVLATWSFSAPSRGHIRQILPIITLWALWEERNRSKHDGVEHNIDRVMSRIVSIITTLNKTDLMTYKQWKGDYRVAQFFQAQVIKPSSRPLSLVYWLPPVAGKLKLNVDGSFTSHGTAGGIL